MTRRRARGVCTVAALVLLTGCGTPDARDAGPPPVATPSAASSSPAAAPPADGPELAPAPSDGDGVWARTLGAPVVAAVRTSTDLARLGDRSPDERAATCRQVAGDLDTIAPPGALVALATSRDAETAALLTADLTAKLDLLAACTTPGPVLDALVDEVAETHDVAVRWLQALEGGP